MWPLVMTTNISFNKYTEEKNEEKWEEIVECQKGWYIEWKVARGELDGNIKRVRTKNKVPEVSEEARGEWRRMEKKNDIKKIIFLREVKKNW